MRQGGWWFVLILCLAWGIGACSPVLISVSPATVTVQGPATMPVTASQTPALVAPTEPALSTLLPPVVTQTSPPLEQDGTPIPGLTPTPTSAASLVAQYDPWSLGHAVTWSPDGRTLAASAGERIYLYTGDAFQEVGEIDTGTWAVSLAFNPQNARMLALAGRDGALQIWDVSRLERLAYLPAHPKGANSVAFSPDGLSLASTGNDALVRLWDVAALLTGQAVEPQAVMIGGAAAVPAIRFSPDGALVASIDLQAIRLRDPATQRLAYTLRSETSMFTISFSPDGTHLAAGELGNQVRIWDLAKQEQTALYHADAGDADPARSFVWSMDFSPQGDLLAAGSSTGLITVWSLPDGEIVQIISAHAKAVSGLAFDPAGHRLASCGLDAVLRIWPIP